MNFYTWGLILERSLINCKVTHTMINNNILWKNEIFFSYIIKLNIKLILVNKVYTCSVFQTSKMRNMYHFISSFQVCEHVENTYLWETLHLINIVSLLELPNNTSCMFILLGLVKAELYMQYSKYRVYKKVISCFVV